MGGKLPRHLCIYLKGKSASRIISLCLSQNPPPVDLELALDLDRTWVALLRLGPTCRSDLVRSPQLKHSRRSTSHWVKAFVAGPSTAQCGSLVCSQRSVRFFFAFGSGQVCLWQGRHVAPRAERGCCSMLAQAAASTRRLSRMHYFRRSKTARVLLEKQAATLSPAEFQHTSKIPPCPV